MSRHKRGSAPGLKLADGTPFRWISPPAHSGKIVRTLPDDRAEVQIDGRDGSQTWYLADIERWLRLGLMIWK